MSPNAAHSHSENTSTATPPGAWAKELQSRSQEQEQEQEQEQRDSAVAANPGPAKCEPARGSARLKPRELHGLALEGFRAGNRGRLALCEALRALHESAGYLELGFSSISGYAALHLHLRRSECFEYLRVSRSLLDLTELRTAFVGGRIGWTVLKAVTRVAKPATQKSWLAYLAKRGPEHTIAESRLAQRDGRDAPRESEFGLPNLDQRLLLRFSRADMDKIRRWLEIEGESIRRRTGAEDVTPEQIMLYLSERRLNFSKGKAAANTDNEGVPEQGDLRDSPGGPEVDPSAMPQTQVVYHRCPDCTRSAVATKEGLVEVDPAVVDAHAGCAESIVLDGPTPRSLRRKLLARESGQCANPNCSRRAEHCHHIVFRSRGGETSRQNEVAVCATCHAMIHAGLLSVEGSASGPSGAGLVWSPVVAAPAAEDLSDWTPTSRAESANADSGPPPVADAATGADLVKGG